MSKIHLKKVAISNRAYYILKQPPGKRCTACDAHKFCPTGPAFLGRHAFRDLQRLVIGHGPGQRARIVWSKKARAAAAANATGTGGAAAGATEITFSVPQIGVAERICRLLRQLYPLAKPITHTHTPLPLP